MTRRFPFIVGLVVVLAAVVTATFVAHLLDDPEHARPPHAQPADSGGTFGPPPLATVGAEHPGQVLADIRTWIEGVQRAEWYAGVERAAEEERLAAARAAANQRVATPGAGSAGSCAGDVDCFLECTRAHESDTSGGYSAVSPNGLYRGAYQFHQQTWDAAVAGAGHDEYVGVPPDQAPPEIQDAAAAHLYSVSGNRPWEGRC